MVVIIRRVFQLVKRARGAPLTARGGRLAAAGEAERKRCKRCEARREGFDNTGDWSRDRDPPHPKDDLAKDRLDGTCRLASTHLSKPLEKPTDPLVRDVRAIRSFSNGGLDWMPVV